MFLDAWLGSTTTSKSITAERKCMRAESPLAIFARLVLPEYAIDMTEASSVADRSVDPRDNRPPFLKTSPLPPLLLLLSWVIWSYWNWYVGTASYP